MSENKRLLTGEELVAVRKCAVPIPDTNFATAEEISTFVDGVRRAQDAKTSRLVRAETLREVAQMLKDHMQMPKEVA